MWFLTELLGKDALYVVSNRAAGEGCTLCGFEQSCWGRTHFMWFVTELLFHTQITAYYSLANTEKINENFRKHSPYPATNAINCT
jgi:hypothetical protein